MRNQRRATRAGLLAGLLLLAASPAIAQTPGRMTGIGDRLRSAEIGWEPLLGGLAIGLALIAFSVLRRRGRGSVTIRIGFPENIEGEFEVRVHRVRARGGARAPRSRTTRRTLRFSRHTRNGVHRETQFDGLTAGLWQVHILGCLSAPRSGCELDPIDERIEFEVSRDTGATVEVALPATRARVELRVHWDRQPARDIGVSLRGRPETLRFSGHGIARLRLAPGRHELLIGTGDRVVERTLVLDDYEPSLSRIDLATSEGLVFKGCPPAVGPYLQGDLGGAARALERDGQSDVASMLLAQLHQEQGQTEHAANALERAGRLKEAADLRRSLADHARAAALYESAGCLPEAAEMYEACDAWSEAARVHGALEDWVKAARAFGRASDPKGQIHALEAQGQLLRAAALASESGDRGRAIRLLQQIGPKDPDHARASELLVLAFEQEGHLDLAAQQLERTLDLLGADESAPALQFRLSEILEELGDHPHALRVLETLRGRDPTYPQVAARIEGLRKKLAESARQPTPSAFRASPGATAFVAEARYEVLEEIGRGGMGRVYKARDRRLGREVALKRMPESLQDHPAAVSLFLGEAQAAARMNHPNIVTLYDADQEQGHFFITMELLDGLPLSTILKKHGPFGPRDTARIALQACAGLAYAHEQGIVHRDIKTANLFITRNKVLKIMDFGLAKILEAVRDDAQTVIAGTPFYMAPEQAAGRVADGRTDLYALGITLFELSTGRLPYLEGDIAEQHRSAPPADPRSIVPDYPPLLAELLQDMMAKHPEERPESASRVAEKLSVFLDIEMTLTPPQVR